MATYTANGGIKLIATGDESGTWGTSTNSNFEIIDKLTNGVAEITLSSTADYNLSDSDGSVDASGGQSKVIVFGGTPGGAVDVIVTSEDAEKLYVIVNNIGASPLTIYQDATKTNSSVAINNGYAAIVYCDGANPGNVTDLTALFVPNLANYGYTGSLSDLNRLDITTQGQTEVNKVVTADSNGDVNFNEEVTAKSYNETYVSLSGTTVDFETGNVFRRVLAANETLTFSNLPASGTAYGFVIEIVQDSGGNAYNVTWPSNVRWPNGATPSLSTAANAVDVFTLYSHDGGTNIYGFLAGRNMS